jgi:hypothetical protein
MQSKYKKLIGVRCGHTFQLPSDTKKQQHCTGPNLTTRNRTTRTHPEAIYPAGQAASHQASTVS